MFDCGNLSNQVLATIGQAFVSAQQSEADDEVPEELQDLPDESYAPCSSYAYAHTDTDVVDREYERAAYGQLSRQRQQQERQPSYARGRESYEKVEYGVNEYEAPETRGGRQSWGDGDDEEAYHKYEEEKGRRYGMKRKKETRKEREIGERERGREREERKRKRTGERWPRD